MPAVSSVAPRRIEFVLGVTAGLLSLRTILSRSVALHLTSRWRSYFRLLALSAAREGLAPSCTRALLLHPHVHLLVPAGGIAPEGTWVNDPHPNFLVPGYALSQIFRAKIIAGLKTLGLLDPSCPCWNQKWDVHCRHAGSGEKILDYLARYVFQVAIVNSRLEKLENG